jgi:hypothetical protein
VLYLGKVRPIREKSNNKKTRTSLEKPTFFKNFLHALFWSSFVELDKGANENSYSQVFGHFDGLSRKPKNHKSCFFLMT